MATEVGEAIIKLSFDGSSVKASLQKSESEITNTGTKSGTAWGNAWSVAAGSLVAKGISKIANTISSNLDRAIKRVDTINNFPKVMTALGYSSEEASDSINEISKAIDGLPTALDTAVGDIQKLAATMGNLNKGTVNATKVGIALNNMFLAGGKGTEYASRAMEQYNQMLGAGRVDMQSWRSMLDAAPGQLTQLAKTLLGTKANAMDLYKALQDGTVTFDQLNQTIIKLNQNGGDGFSSFEEQARAATGGIGTALENLQTRVAKAIAKVIDHLDAEKIANIINEISSGFSGVADVVINIIDFLIQNQWILDIITAFFTGLLAMGIATKIQGLFTMLTAFATQNPVILAIGAIVAGFTLIMTNLDTIGQFFQNVFGAIGDFVGGVWNGIMSGAQAVWNFITGIFGNLANFFGSIFGAAWEAVKNVFSTGGRIFMGIVDGIVNAFKAIVNTIIKGINFVVAIPFNAINGFLSFLRGINILGFQPFTWVQNIGVPQIPYLAEGGYASGTTPAVIGENGKEVVLPLENNTDNWAGLLASVLTEQMEEESESGRTINVYMNNNINNKLDAEEIGSIMMQSIRRAS
jgi:tape measure domain-containing protein